MNGSEDNLIKEIQGLVDLETRGWDAKDPGPFLSIIHPDMVWAWPPNDQAHDPIDWVFDLGRYDHDRWRKSWQDLFDTHDLVHNKRTTRAIKITREGDGAFAVVDVDTLWRNKKTGREIHWLGRACKFYTRMPGGEWKLIGHSGLLTYPPQGPCADRAK